ncbi:MAG: metallophosphoesterase [Vicinamibacterales bacterium]
MHRQMPLTAIVLLACSVLTAQQPPLTVTLPNGTGTVKFAAMGDNGTGQRPQYEVAARMSEARRHFDFDFVIMLGDNMYGRQRPEDFVTKFERPYEALLDDGVKFYAALGNHDDQSNRFYKPWNMNGERYYTYTKGDVRFFVLDSDYMDPKQLDWLTRELRKSNDRWKIAYFHHPLYSSAARHGSETDLRLILEPLFVRYGVNAVFSGHDHTYERITPQKGIYYFVSGSAGQLRRGDLRRSQLTAAGFDQDNAFMLVEIEDDALSVQALTRGGRTVDAVMLSRQPARTASTTAAANRR